MLKRWWRVAVLAILALPLFAVAGSAGEGSDRSERRTMFDTSRSATNGSSQVSAAQHDGTFLHLPPVQENIDLVGKLEVNTPPEFRFAPPADPSDPPTPDPGQPQVVPGQIADVAVYKNAAYLQSWAEPSCKRGGFFSVDITDPANPKQLAFVPALPGTYHGEGAHARTINTTFFNGDMLAVNNEDCDPSGTGGFDLYDVSDPANPKILVQGFGDQSPEGDPPFDDGGLGDTTPDPRPESEGGVPKPRSNHSIFIWQDADKAYAVIVDNIEIHDVDIFDITNPRAPKFIADIDLIGLAEAQGLDIIGNSANGDNWFHHDMVVKEIGGVQTMLVSYWDAGYVTLNVEDPTHPVVIGDQDFGTEDPLVVDPRTPSGSGFAPPEGNAHEAEFSHDNRFVLAADEDFAAYRPDKFEITTGTNEGEYESAQVAGGAGAANLPDKTMNGPVVYGGYGCPQDPTPDIPDADTVLPPDTLGADEEQILVLQRGPAFDPDEDYDGDGETNNDPDDACFPGEKAGEAVERGWDAVLLVNRHQASGDPADDSAFCGSGGFPAGPPIVAICTTHEAFHLMFEDDPEFDVPYDDSDVPAAGDHPLPADGPNIGDIGEKVRATSIFDGWGYTHLFRNDGSTLTPVDHFAIDEGIDSRFGTGDFGTLSVHEFATDPTEYLAYSAYYAGGMRVVRFGDSGMEQVGAFIDEGGNDFWGVEQFTTPQGDRLFAGSDRDYGLYLFRYTGPGAAEKPFCSDTTVLVPFHGSTDVLLPCSDANANPLTESIVSGPTRGTLSGDPNSGKVTYTHTGRRLGRAGSFTFKANDGAADSNVATASLVAVPGNAGRCANPFRGSRRRDIIVGSRFGDRISGIRGNDDLEGRRGRDCLIGGRGLDDLFGGRGNDRLSGGLDSDELRGGPGRDVLRGLRGNDKLIGGSGRDRFSGGAGNDQIVATRGGVDRIRCGAGFDRVLAGATDRVGAGCESVERR
jgi:hypothetical protein